MNKFKDHPFKVYLGDCKNTGYGIYLTGFSWDCNWYYGGGYLGYYNKIGRPSLQIHTHFDVIFLNQKIENNRTALWYNLKDLVDNPQFNNNEWWRIKDLYKQFYISRDCAEVFQYGGNCISEGRSKNEINKDMADKINKHIENNIISEIKKILKVK